VDGTIDYSRKWYVMSAVAMGIFLATIDMSIVNVALPTLVRSFDSEFAVVQWVVLAYLLTVATLMLSIGRWADIVGKKPLYTVGVAIFTVGSALCGLAPTVYWLIGFRVLQATGAAMTAALGMAIITEAFPASERGKALGIGGSIVSVGIVLGPTLGGILIDALSWHWIFFVNVPIGIVGIFMVARFVPNFKPAGGQRFDYWGAITLFVSLTCLLLALTVGQRVGFSRLPILLLFSGWAVFLAVFVVIELKTSQPMIDFSMFENRLFSINLITGFITFVTIAGTIILMPFYLEEVLGYETREVGLLLAVLPLAMGLIAPLAGTASDRFGARPIIVIGLLVLVVGYAALSTLDQQTTTLGYMVRFLPIGLGMGIFLSPNNSAIMGGVSRDRLGVASGLLALTRSLGQTVGVATLGALWAGRVVYYLGGVLLGGATSAAAPVQAAALGDTFHVIVVLMSLALMLSVWGLIQERRRLARERMGESASQRISGPVS
jgi:EmrB/QacA subfamily drug resistance transporter